MTRPLYAWLVYALCVAAGGLALGGVTRTALHMEQAQREAQQQTALQEVVRVALYRMDTFLTPLVGAEASRLPGSYLAPQTVGANIQGYTAGETVGMPFVRLRFEIPPTGDPVLSSTDADAALPSDDWLTKEALQPALRMAETERSDVPKTVEVAQVDWSNRIQGLAQSTANSMVAQQAMVAPPGPPVESGLLAPMWLNGERLVMARRVRLGAKDERIQGCWINNQALTQHLEASIRDLLPRARVVPATGELASAPYRLAALPLALEPGDAPEPPASSSPVRQALLVAWACAVCAAAAVGLLLRGTLAVSERRAAFVSAVTHELRTPLTTFRLYSDMLAEGLVTDDAKRRQYYETLRAEAVRLGHLVENVLAYARIERRRAPQVQQPTRLGDVWERITEGLGQQAKRAGRPLDVSVDERVMEAQLRADAAVLERILMNLVDNACKHGRPASDPTVRLSVQRKDTQLAFTVSDSGPGVPADVRRRLFRPFSRSAREAAGAAAGVGLGLALSRRLARQSGGDLRLAPDASAGASFLLILPTTATRQ